MSSDSIQSRSRSMAKRRPVTTRIVVPVTAQNRPATWPSSSRTGEQEKVKKASSSTPCRFTRRGRSSR